MSVTFLAWYGVHVSWTNGLRALDMCVPCCRAGRATRKSARQILPLLAADEDAVFFTSGVDS
eukprot:9469148-Pyramimonas_sp.AAC.1